MDMEIIDVLGENGLFHKAIGEQYEIRTQQIDLASKIETCIKNYQHLIAEAPCGVGKSYAYLIPAIKSAIEMGQSIVIVTANIALQEQLINKDLPCLQEILPVEFTYALVKGKNNYLCKDHAEETRLKRDYIAKAWDKISQKRFKAILDWREKTETGDKSELSFDPPIDLWSYFSIQDSDCKGKHCSYKSTCFCDLARKKGKTANVVVCNYHILLLDAQIKEKTQGFAQILPPYSVLICDEGHRLEEISREFFGEEVSCFSYRRITSALDRLSKRNYIDVEYATKLIENIKKENANFFSKVIEYHKNQGNNYIRTTESNIVNYEPLCNLLKEASVVIAEVFLDIEENDDKDKNKNKDKEISVFENRAKEAKEIAAKIRNIITQSKAESYAYWIENRETPRGMFTQIIGRPIYVQQYLDKLLWSNIKTYILLSATMAVPSSNCNGKDDFSFMINTLGLPEKINTFFCESPFDFEKQTLLIIPENISSPKQENDYRESFAKEIQKAIMYAKGRTLVLFTSYSHMRYFYEKSTEIRKKYNVLIQGDGRFHRTELIKRFREDTHSVLLGTASFWEGIDVPGEALSMLVIDRLPFINPKQDPILDALNEISDNFFNNEYVPRAIIKLKQGIGRLIRNKKDYGVIVIADRRLMPNEERYSLRFLASLPTMNGVFSIENIKDFFKNH